MTESVWVKTAGVTSDAQVAALTNTQKRIGATYYDGYGRPLQKIKVGQSPNGYSIVSFAQYGQTDSYGLDAYAFLPYTAANTGAGYRASGATEQTAYYSNGASDDVTDDASPWSKSIYEAGPLQRLLYSGGNGDGFQASPGTSGQHYQSYNYRTNNSSLYASDAYNGGVRLWLSDGTSSGTYPTGSLDVTETIDEAGHSILSYSNTKGKQILKRQIITQTINGTTEYCLDTYYVYDDLGRLRMIIPPKALATIRNAAASPWSAALGTVANLIYQYNYDAYGRMIEKKVPSGGWMYIVYDPLDRPVLVQDANLHATNRWMYMKYDSRKRIIARGVYKDAVNGVSRTAMQNYVSGLNYSTTYCEKRQNGTSPIFYTNTSFPTANQDGTALQDLAYYYYDDYDLDRNGTDDYTYTAQGLTGEIGATTNVNGFNTVIFTKTLNNDASLSVWLKKVIFYDKRGNLVQIQSGNQTNPTVLSDIKTIVADFVGKTTIEKTSKTVGSTTTTTQVTYTYDNGERLVAIDQSNNGGSSVRIAAYAYNELGERVQKKLHNTSGSTYLQNVDYRYNINGQLTSINNSTLSVDNTNYTNADANDLFGEEILYDKTDANIANTANYVGLVSAVKWESQSTANNSQRSYTYTYDALNRFTGASYADRASGSTGAWGNTHANDETIGGYDHDGNFTSLTRKQAAATIDNLTYTYNGDQLSNVADAGTTAGFNGTNTTAYSFDANGNQTADPKKGLNTAFNVLNRTDKITFTGNSNYIRYTYDVTGNVIRKEVNNAGTVTTYDYIDNFVYVNSVLSYFKTAEGRVRNSSGTLTFEYFIRDHLGNVRVSFDGGTTAAVRQENSYYPLGMTLPGNYTPTTPNLLLYNGGSEWQNDFANLPDVYQSGSRNYDYAVGRFLAVDPYASMTESMHPYQFGNNNPVSFMDPSGNVAPGGSVGADDATSWDAVSLIQFYYNLLTSGWSVEHGGILYAADDAAYADAQGQYDNFMYAYASTAGGSPGAAGAAAGYSGGSGGSSGVSSGGIGTGDLMTSKNYQSPAQTDARSQWLTSIPNPAPLNKLANGSSSHIGWSAHDIAKASGQPFALQPGMYYTTPGGKTYYYPGPTAPSNTAATSVNPSLTAVGGGLVTTQSTSAFSILASVANINAGTAGAWQNQMQSVSDILIFTRVVGSDVYYQLNGFDQILRSGQFPGQSSAINGSNVSPISTDANSHIAVQ